MAEEMTNIEIRDFLTVSGVGDTDYVVLSLSEGTSGKMAVGVFRSAIASGITPNIREGLWWIGEKNTEVVAEGRTPSFRKTSLGIEWRYTSGPDTAWKLLVPMADIVFKFSDLTAEQRDSITLKYSDLTEAEIKDLQRPATDMITTLEETNANASAAEQLRVEAESARKDSEALREQGEATRKMSEDARVAAESARAEAEQSRNASESARKEAESGRASAESQRVSQENIRQSQEQTRQTQENARVAAESSRVEAEKARVYAESGRVQEFASLKSESQDATAYAIDTASHPTYVGEDNYVYQWNHASQSYDKTSVYVRGEGFHISKTYASVAAMEADKSHGLKEGDFVLINTGDVENPDNAKIYVVSAQGAFTFLVDMSGAIGFTGKTPQLLVGSVAVGSGKASAEVTLSSDGTDADGNPKYRINYIIPCLAYEDLTGQQIAELQRPASDMIAVLRQTDESVQSAEASRVQAESLRADAEASRKSSEASRSEAELVRAEAEQVRVNAELSRYEAELARAEADTRRKEDYQTIRQDAVAATGNANAAAQEARNLPIIQNGTWWLYDVEKGVYVDSGYAVSSDYQLTKEKVEGVLVGNIESHTHDKYAIATEINEALKQGLDSKQPVIEDLEVIRSGAALGATALQSVPEEYVTESELQSKGYATTASVNQSLLGKVDKVDGKQLSTEDFTTALKDKLSSLQNYNDAAITEAVNSLRSDFDTLVSGDTTTAIKSFNDIVAFLDGISDSEDLDSIIAGIEQQISGKQEQNLYFTNLKANHWVSDSTFVDFPYRCDLACAGVTSQMYAEVVFGVGHATSGVYAPVCETGDGIVSIWSSSEFEVTVPTIVVNK